MSAPHNIGGTNGGVSTDEANVRVITSGTEATNTHTSLPTVSNSSPAVNANHHHNNNNNNNNNNSSSTSNSTSNNTRRTPLQRYSSAGAVPLSPSAQWHAVLNQLNGMMQLECSNIQKLLKSYGVRVGQIQALAEKCQLASSKRLENTSAAPSAIHGKGADEAESVEMMNRQQQQHKRMFTQVVQEVLQLMYCLYPLLLGCCSCHLNGSDGEEDDENTVAEREANAQRYNVQVSDATRIVNATKNQSSDASERPAHSNGQLEAHATPVRQHTVPPSRCLQHWQVPCDTQVASPRARMRTFTRLALRIFVGVLRFGVDIPCVSLTGVLMLLSALPNLIEIIPELVSSRAPLRTASTKSDAGNPSAAKTPSSPSSPRDPSSTITEDERVLSALQFALTSLFVRDPESFHSILDQLVNEQGVIGSFALRGSPSLPGDMSHGQCNVRLSVGDDNLAALTQTWAAQCGANSLNLTEVIKQELCFSGPFFSVSPSQKNESEGNVAVSADANMEESKVAGNTASRGVVFRCRIAGNTATEIARVAYGFIAAYTGMLRVQVPLQPTEFGRYQLVRLCCGLLSLDVCTARNGRNESHSFSSGPKHMERIMNGSADTVTAKTASVNHKGHPEQNVLDGVIHALCNRVGDLFYAMQQRQLLSRESEGVTLLYALIRFLDVQLRNGADMWTPASQAMWIENVLRWVLVNPNEVSRIERDGSPVAARALSNGTADPFYSEQRRALANAPLASRSFDEGENGQVGSRQTVTSGDGAGQIAGSEAAFHAALMSMCTRTSVLYDVLDILLPDDRTFDCIIPMDGSIDSWFHSKPITSRVPFGIASQLVRLLELFCALSTEDEVTNWFDDLLFKSNSFSKKPNAFPSPNQHFLGCSAIGKRILDTLLFHRSLPLGLLFAQSSVLSAIDGAASLESDVALLIRISRLLPESMFVPLLEDRLLELKATLIDCGAYGVVLSNCELTSAKWQHDTEYVQSAMSTIQSHFAGSSSAHNQTTPKAGSTHDDNAAVALKQFNLLRSQMESLFALLTYSPDTEIRAVAVNLLGSIPVHQLSNAPSSLTRAQSSSYSSSSALSSLFTLSKPVGGRGVSPEQGHAHHIHELSHKQSPLPPLCFSPEYDGVFIGLVIGRSSMDDLDELLPRIRPVFSASCVAHFSTTVKHGITWEQVNRVMMWIGALRGFNTIALQKMESLQLSNWTISESTFSSSTRVFPGNAGPRAGASNAHSYATFSGTADAYRHGKSSSESTLHTQEIESLLRAVTTMLDLVLPLIHIACTLQSIGGTSDGPAAAEVAGGTIPQEETSTGVKREGSTDGTAASGYLCGFFAEVAQLQLAALVLADARGSLEYVLAAAGPQFDKVHQDRESMGERYRSPSPLRSGVKRKERTEGESDTAANGSQLNNDNNKDADEEVDRTSRRGSKGKRKSAAQRKRLRKGGASGSESPAKRNRAESVVDVDVDDTEGDEGEIENADEVNTSNVAIGHGGDVENDGDEVIVGYTTAKDATSKFADLAPAARGGGTGGSTSAADDGGRDARDGGFYPHGGTEDLLDRVRQAHHRMAAAMHQAFYSLRKVDARGSSLIKPSNESEFSSHLDSRDTFTWSNSSSSGEGCCILSAYDLCLLNLCLGVAGAPDYSESDTLVLQYAASHRLQTIRLFAAPLAISAILKSREDSCGRSVCTRCHRNSGTNIEPDGKHENSSTCHCNDPSCNANTLIFDKHWLLEAKVKQLSESGLCGPPVECQNILLLRQLTTFTVTVCEQVALTPKLPLRTETYRLGNNSSISSFDSRLPLSSSSLAVREVSENLIEPFGGESTQCHPREHHGRNTNRVEGQCYDFLQQCLSLLNSTAVSHSVQSLSVESVQMILRHCDWSLEELCRRAPEMVYWPAFPLLCELADVQPREVVKRCMDVLLPPCILEGDGDRLKQLVSISGDEHFSESGFPTVVSYALFQNARSSTCEKMRYLSTIATFMGRQVADLPQLFNRRLATITVYLLAHATSGLRRSKPVSPAGGDAAKQDEPGVRASLGSMSSFALTDPSTVTTVTQAIQLAVTLSEAQLNDGGVEKALSTPLAMEEVTQILTKYVFDVVDVIAREMGNDQELQSNTVPARHVSNATRHRWLMATSLLIQVLDKRTILIAPKIPALLEECSHIPALVHSVVSVWCDVIRSCTTEYLVEHGPSIVVDLLSFEMNGMESKNGANNRDTMRLLQEAMKTMYTSTSGALFWQSYFMVMGRTSVLVKNLRSEVARVAAADEELRAGDLNGDEEDETIGATKRGNKRRGRRASSSRRTRGTSRQRAPSEGPAGHEAALSSSANAAMVVSGFVTVMHASSAKCRTVFVKGLHQYLQTCDRQTLHEMTEAACRTPSLVPTLLVCARELPTEEAKQSALQCVGKIGAISPSAARTFVSATINTPSGSAAEPNSPAPNSRAQTAATTTTLSPSGELDAIVWSNASDLEALRLDKHFSEFTTSWRSLAAILLRVFCPRALANTADSRMHDRAAYAIQELLRVCANQERLEQGGLRLMDSEVVHVDELQRYSWWASLGPKLQVILEPFTTTRYATLVIQKSERRVPEYRRGMGFNTWSLNWFRNLVTRCGGIFGDIVGSLRNVAKRDTALSGFLLPLTVIHLLERGETQDFHDILTEFQTVFDQCDEYAMNDATTNYGVVSRRATQGTSHHFSGVSQSLHATRRSMATPSVAMASATTRSATANVEEHVQQLLIIVEYVERLRATFLKLARDATNPTMPSGHDKTTLEHSSEKYAKFLLNLSFWKRAAVAASINSNIRALRFIESQRYLPNVNELLERGKYLQDVFARLDDRDSAKSIHVSAQPRPPGEVALSYENTGQWTLTMESCELYLQLYPDSFQHQLALLRCMQNLGKLHLMSRYAQSLVQQYGTIASLGNARKPSLRSFMHDIKSRVIKQALQSDGQRGNGDCIQSGATHGSIIPSVQAEETEKAAAVIQHYSNEAAWRLGEWEYVQPRENMGVSLAQPLASLMSVLNGTGTLEEVQSSASLERTKLFPLVSAACREGYRQGYSYVAILHALSDVETVADTLWKEGQLRQQWLENHHNHHPQQQHQNQFHNLNFSRPNTQMTKRPHASLAGGNLSNGRAVGSAVNGQHLYARETRGKVIPFGGGENAEGIMTCGGTMLSSHRVHVQDKLVPLLTRRLRAMEPTLEAQEPVLSAHRAIFTALDMEDVASESWMRHAKLLRNEGHFEAALNIAKLLCMGPDSSNPRYFVTVAKLLYEMKEVSQAIEFASEVVERRDVPQLVRDKLRVLMTSWRQDGGSMTTKDVIGAYKEVIQSQSSSSSSEDAHYHLAMFYDKLFHSASTTSGDAVTLAAGATAGAALGSSPTSSMSAMQMDDARAKDYVTATDLYLLPAIESFGAALKLGDKTVSVSLPRMLTLWLDCTARLSEISKLPLHVGKVASDKVIELTGAINTLLIGKGCISPALTMTALSQLLSRLSHPHPVVVDLITRIVVHLMTFFPQQCLWNVLPLACSKQMVRAQITKNQILSAYVKKGKSENNQVNNGYIIFSGLTEFCNAPPTAFQSRVAKLSRMIYIQKIQNILPAAHFILPVMSNFTANLRVIHPRQRSRLDEVMKSGNGQSGIGGEPVETDLYENSDSDFDEDAETARQDVRPAEVFNASDEHVAVSRDPLSYVFPSSPTFASFDDEVDVMTSLQKPKRITVISNEGKRVPFLCKAKDEPRKDMRMMEVAALMNTFFLANPEARRRRFFLRRYSVAALSDDCAMIEWVSNTAPLRRIVDECYMLDRSGVKTTQVKQWKAKVDSKAMTMLDMLQKLILPAAKPVFHQWFHRTFENNQAWYDARTLYTQTCALWSIAGHIVGLGDRHGENLMVDLGTGGIMHVDFACMFDKGETLEVPECVRFRLTQNVVDAMGVFGMDGPFRACCELALRCEMRNKKAVMSVVETLLHDPLIEWTPRPTSSRRQTDPRQLIERVSRRLDGFLDLLAKNGDRKREVDRDTLPLNVEAQVSTLISHSSSLENLSDMYLWWMAWI